MQHSDMTSKRKTAYVETYGCQMNVADGELMQGILASAGYDLAATPEAADIILVNTCAIRDHAEQRVIGRVGELARIKQERPDVVIGVTGCMAQRMGQQLLDQARYVELVMGPDGYRSLPDVLASLRPRLDRGSGIGDRGAGATGQGPAKDQASRIKDQGRALPVLPVSTDPRSTIPDPRFPSRIAAVEFDSQENYEGLEVKRISRVSAWVPVQRGCNYRCTYCIVPYVRGSEKNRDPNLVLAEVRGLAEQGIPEVTLLGQTVNSYEHGDWNFAHLLRAVARVDGIRRVRFTSPHPNDLTPELVAVMAEEPAVCNQLHLPVQSGHNRTLKRMLRRYTVESYFEKIEMVRAAIPQIALSTDVIVAFPGETVEEYEATLALLRTVRFDDAYLYKYSVREGTPATRLPAAEFIPEAEAQHRLERIIELHRSIQAEINRATVGQVHEVLIERSARSPGDLLGRTESNKVVAFPGDPSRIGQFTTVRLTQTSGSTFTGVEMTADAVRVA